VDDNKAKKFAFQIAVKPLQIETWLLLTAEAYRNSSSPYSTLLSRLPTTYRLTTIHARQTDRRHRPMAMASKVNLTVEQKLSLNWI